ncbi:MAG: hypothetical protein PHI12_07875 [Dehalococcoidales bacterium]|jgi:hypothetical protein|nr:hypothetical protein [Dehalococcoidales bacterium]
MNKVLIDLPRPDLVSSSPVFVCHDCGVVVAKGWQYDGVILCEECYIEAQPYWKRLAWKGRRHENTLPRLRAAKRAVEERLARRH